MTKVDEIAMHIRATLKQRFNEGETHVELRAGDLWNLLQVKLGLTGITQVCGAMRAVARESEFPSRLLYEPPRGNSTSVLICYYKDSTAMQADSRTEFAPQQAKRNPGSVRQAKTSRQRSIGRTTTAKTITIEELNEATQLVNSDLRYGAEGNIIRDCFIKFPLNTDDSIIAMKIALIDMTNSTNLNKHLGKIYLTGLIAKIKGCNFDERVARGDATLVGELANSGAKNLFSFFSKYCLYHNYYVYKRDDFVIFDSVMRDHVGEYIAEYTHDGKTYSSSAIKGLINSMRQAYDYAGYKSLIDSVLDANGIQDEFWRRKFDWFVWYNNRTRDGDPVAAGE